MLDLPILTTFDPRFFTLFDYLVMASSCSSHGLEHNFSERKKLHQEGSAIKTN